MKSTIPCKNPDHPRLASKFSMALLEETPEREVWACQACKDVLKVVSAQVKTKPAYQRHLRREMRKAGFTPPKPTPTPYTYHR